MSSQPLENTQPRIGISILEALHRRHGVLINEQYGSCRWPIEGGWCLLRSVSVLQASIFKTLNRIKAISNSSGFRLQYLSSPKEKAPGNVEVAKVENKERGGV
jgi:hypothetical protein